MKFVLLLLFLVYEVPVLAQTQDSNQSAAPKIKVRTVLVNEPVTVRNHDGGMVNNLEPKDFKITDNGVEQTITHFELGGDSISLVVLVETSSRIEAVLPALRKSGSVVSQIVMGPNAEAAVVGFNDAVDRLQDFASSGDQNQLVPNKPPEAGCNDGSLAYGIGSADNFQQQRYCGAMVV